MHETHQFLSINHHCAHKKSSFKINASVVYLNGLEG